MKIDGVVRDPGLGPVTVTGVDVTPDLWVARVFVETHGSPEEQSRSMAALRRAAPFLRSVIGRELHIRRMPALRFHRDESIEAGQRIEAILRQVLPPDAEPPDEELPDEEPPGREPPDEEPPGREPPDEEPPGRDPGAGVDES